MSPTRCSRPHSRWQVLAAISWTQPGLTSHEEGQNLPSRDSVSSLWSPPRTGQCPSDEVVCLQPVLRRETVRRSKCCLSLSGRCNPHLAHSSYLPFYVKPRESHLCSRKNGFASLGTLIIWAGMLADNPEDAQLFILASPILSSRLLRSESTT